jgi:hypothetical protein
VELNARRQPQHHLGGRPQDRAGQQMPAGHPAPCIGHRQMQVRPVDRQRARQRHDLQRSGDGERIVAPRKPQHRRAEAADAGRDKPRRLRFRPEDRRQPLPQILPGQQPHREIPGRRSRPVDPQPRSGHRPASRLIAPTIPASPAGRKSVPPPHLDSVRRPA